MESKISLRKIDINKIIDFFEKDRFTPSTAFIYLIIIGAVRSISESLYFEYPMFSMYLIIQHIAFNFPVLVLGVFVIYKATGAKIKKVFNVVLLGISITAIPAFIDKFIFGLSGYEYSGIYSYYAGFEGALFIEKIGLIASPHLRIGEQISPGLRIMGFSIFVLSTIYILIKIDIFKLKKNIIKRERDEIIKKISAIFFGFFGIWMVVWFITASVPSVIGWEGNNIILLDYFRTNMSPEHYFFFSEYGYSIQAGNEVFPAADSNTIGLALGTIIQQRSLFITMYFTILTTISFLFTLYSAKKELLINILHTVNTPLVYLTTIMALLGNSILHQLDVDFSKGWALDPTYPLHLPYIFYILTIGFFIGCFAIFINRAYNPKNNIPRNPMSIYVNKKLAIVSFLAVASFSFIMGPFNTFPLALGFMVVIFLIKIYSNNLSTFSKGLSFSIIGIFSFFIGFYTPGIWKSVIWTTQNNIPRPETYRTIDLTRNPSITGLIIGLIIVLFLMLLIIGYISKLLKNDKFPLDYPKSYVLIPIFLLPNLIFMDLLLVGIFATLGSISITFMDNNYKMPLIILAIQIGFIIFWVWGFIPSI